MAKVIKSTLVTYTAQQMYELVNDIERYPEFLPWCDAAQVEQLQADELQAELTFAQGPVRKSFTTRNYLVPGERMEMRLVDGPFKKLEGIWQFDALPDGCKVNLALEFEFNNILMKTMLGSAFDEIANTMLEHFCTQADKLYGNKASDSPVQEP